MEQLIDSLKALGEKNRMEIVKALLGERLCVNALADRLNISKSSVSQHLKVLRDAGIVTGVSIGHHTHYRVNREKLVSIGETINDYLDSVSLKCCNQGNCGKHD